MKFESFSKTQLTALSWWSDASPYRSCDALICDGAVRSGKTLCMGISFVCWAMRRFDGERFDHAMDEIRYFAVSVAKRETDEGFAMWVDRR